ncbi:hypothetical protein AgCh_024100 [Apium graveolens]
MAKTRRTIRTLEGGAPTGTIQVISSTVEVPPHSTYAATQEEAQIGATEPQPQGTIPLCCMSEHQAQASARSGPWRKMLSSKDVNFVGYTYKNFEIINDYQVPRMSGTKRWGTGTLLLTGGSTRVVDLIVHVSELHQLFSCVSHVQ